MKCCPTSAKLLLTNRSVQRLVARESSAYKWSDVNINLIPTVFNTIFGHEPRHSFEHLATRVPFQSCCFCPNHMNCEQTRYHGTSSNDSNLFCVKPGYQQLAKIWPRDSLMGATEVLQAPHLAPWYIHFCRTQESKQQSICALSFFEAIAAHADLSEQSMQHLAITVWDLMNKHGQTETKNLVRVRTCKIDNYVAALVSEMRFKLRIIFFHFCGVCVIAHADHACIFRYKSWKVWKERAAISANWLLLCLCNHARKESPFRHECGGGSTMVLRLALRLSLLFIFAVLMLHSSAINIALQNINEDFDEVYVGRSRCGRGGVALKTLDSCVHFQICYYGTEWLGTAGFPQPKDGIIVNDTFDRQNRSVGEYNWLSRFFRS